MRLEVHAVPGAKSTRVGGTHDGALVVRVTARAVDGRATLAVRRAVADALGLPVRDVRVVAGASARRKVLELDGDRAGLASTLEALRGPMGK